MVRNRLRILARINMELKRISFEYKIEEKRFERISYGFNPLDFNLKDLTEEEIKSKVNSQFRQLEQIIDKEFTIPGITKEKEGAVGTNFIEFGYKYYGNPKKLLSQGQFVHNTLSYTVTTYNNMKNTAQLDMKISDSNLSPRTLNIYDTVLSLPDLKIAESVKIEINKINHLRNEDFDFNNYTKKFLVLNSQK